MTCVPWSFHSSFSYPYLVLSVDGARVRVRYALVLVPVPVHGVARLRPAAVVRTVRDPVAALRPSRSRDRGRKPSEALPRSLGGPINAPHEEAVEFAKHSKQENRVYVGNLRYDVKYRDLIEFMRGGRWGRFINDSWPLLFFFFGFGDCFIDLRLLRSCKDEKGQVWIRPMSCGQ